MFKKFPLLVILFLTFAARNAYAVVFLDFDRPVFARESAGDHNHDGTTHPLLNSADGNISFNGRISNRLDGDAIPDHTLGTTAGSFLKNTSGADGDPFLTFLFDYDVKTFEFFANIEDGFTGYVDVFDLGGNLLDSDSGTTGGVWDNGGLLGNYAAPIRSLTFYSTNSNNRVRGNKLALDDITITPYAAHVPEPSSLLLLGLSFAGLGFSRLKKFRRA